MAGSSRWYFDKRSLADSPSKRCGIEAEEELSYRQQAANLIQEMGQRLKVTQLCINTAIVYMHRFYVFHSITRFRKTQIAACALFLAAKVEEQPRKLEYVVRIAQQCLNHQITDPKQKEKFYQEQANLLVKNENIMLQTLGFDIAIEHPHTFVVKCCQLVRASKDLAQTCYFMATNSLHLTTMCLQYKPTIVACVCIHLASKWSNWEIPKSSEDKDWFWYVDQGVSLDKIEELTAEFLAIYDKCPSRLKRKMNVFPGAINDVNPPDRRDRERRDHEKREFELRVEKDRLEREESERKERDKAERERLEKERVERERAERERAERERVEREKIEREKIERERIERERLERERLERERAERERIERERIERERIERERIERERAERERVERERAERERAERERAERERAERERVERERAERERLEREKFERERAQREHLEWQRELERIEHERMEHERMERERIERERMERERIERERMEHERIEREREEIEQEQRRERERQERDDNKRPPIKLILKLGRPKSEPSLPAKHRRV